MPPPSAHSSTRFCLSGAPHAHALTTQRAEAEAAARGADAVAAVGQQWQQLTHLPLRPPAPAHQATALASRYYTSGGPGFLFPQRSEVPKQAYAYCPVFSLSHNTTTSSHASSAKAVVALRPAAERRVSTTTAVHRHQHNHHHHHHHHQQQQQQQQLEQQQSLPQQEQPKRKRRPASAAADAAQPSEQLPAPWLGAQLDVGGYTKRGFISGGGKDQNQDRGLILEAFRSPSELLLGVFDGHGTDGHTVSTFLAQHLPAVLMQKLVAAAAAALNTSSSKPQAKQRRLFGRGSNKQDDQEQQQQQDLQFAVSHVPYVVVPDHRQAKYGPLAAAAADAGSSGSSSSSAGSLSSARQQQNGGRAVGKQQLVQQPQSHALGDNPDSSSSSSSAAQPPWLTPVSHARVKQVPLSQALLSGAFSATDLLLSGSGINVVDSGSTAVLCHIGPSSITTAWVGDSRAVLGRRKQGGLWGQTGPSSKQQQQQPPQQEDEGSTGSSLPPPAQQQQQQADVWEAVPLSIDHKPERHDEHLRISLSEGRVAQIMGRGPYRVWFQGLDWPGLAMSRAFGDLPCRRIGVTCEPEVSSHALTPRDQLLIVASDGVWDVLSNQEALELAGSAPGAQAAARSLVEVAEGRWLDEQGGYIDDITAVVVRAAPLAGGAESDQQQR